MDGYLEAELRGTVIALVHTNLDGPSKIVPASTLPSTAPGVVSTNVGAVANGTNRTLSVSVGSAANLRLNLTSSSAQNSRSLTVSFAGREIPLSVNAGQTVNVDLAGVSAGTQTLIIRATGDGVSLGRVEFVTF